MPFDSTKFYLGVNIGWLNNAYRWDLSSTYNDDRAPITYPNVQFEDMIDAYFSHLQFKQIKVVRMWLLEGLEGMGLFPSPPNYFQLAPSTFTYNKWVDFKKRITIIMKKAEKYNLQIYWCLLDAAWLTNKKDMITHIWYKPVFKFLVEKQTARDNFKKDILLPFLKSIYQFKANVFAIDIVNEVDWIWDKGIVDRINAVSFVKEIYNYIKNNSPHLCTVSFHNYEGWTGTVPQNEKVDFLDFYDYHKYFDPAAKKESKHGDLKDWPGGKSCIIGEAGHKFYGKQCISQEIIASTGKELMEQALERKYSGILLWRYTPVSNDQHRLLRLCACHPGTSGSPSKTVLSYFLTQFKAAALKFPYGDNNPFEDYERPIWSEIHQFVGTIPNNRRP